MARGIPIIKHCHIPTDLRYFIVLLLELVIQVGRSSVSQIEVKFDVHGGLSIVNLGGVEVVLDEAPRIVIEGGGVKLVLLHFFQVGAEIILLHFLEVINEVRHERSKGVINVDATALAESHGTRCIQAPGAVGSQR